MADLFQDMGATFSPCRKWRYKLWRIWDSSLPLACFVLMNPSTADEVNDDPTVARCQKRVEHWPDMKIGGVIVANAFAWRETDSRKLPSLVASGEDIVGPENDRYIAEAAAASAIVVCGWGAPGNIGNRGEAVRKLIVSAGRIPHYLVLNDDGTPRHPLYTGYAVKPQPWEKA